MRFDQTQYLRSQESLPVDSQLALAALHED